MKGRGEECPLSDPINRSGFVQVCAGKELGKSGKDNTAVDGMGIKKNEKRMVGRKTSQGVWYIVT